LNSYQAALPFNATLAQAVRGLMNSRVSSPAKVFEDDSKAF
jgi:hypothetical protein